jgi:hypothetical protein
MQLVLEYHTMHIAWLSKTVNTFLYPCKHSPDEREAKTQQDKLRT